MANRQGIFFKMAIFFHSSILMNAHGEDSNHGAMITHGNCNKYRVDQNEISNKLSVITDFSLPLTPDTFFICFFVCLFRQAV